MLALVSGGALLTVVAWGLWLGVRQAGEREALVAQRAAADLATALRAALRSPAIVALAPAADRFELVDGSVQVDAEVGWLVAAAAAPDDGALDVELRDAQIAEFVAGDHTRAAQRFDDLLGPRGPGGDGALPVLGAAAWQAVRAGEAERARSLRTRLADRLAAVPPAALAEVRTGEAIAGLALLTAACREPLPPALAACVVALPPALALPTLARLQERGVDTAGLAAAHARLAARRDLLRVVASALREPPDHAVARALGDRLLLWFPGDSAPGHGRGALVERTWLSTLPGLGTSRPSAVAALPPVPDRGELVFAAPGPDAEDVVPGALWVAPQQPQPAPWFARASAIGVAGATLVLVFAASALAMWRAARREAAALRARSEFLTGVTHELKTPVASMRLIAEVLRDDDVTAERRRDYVALLAGEATRLSALVDNVLDLGQMERGERACDRRPGDLADVVRDVVAAFTPLAAKARLRVVLREGAASAPALVDALALSQALLNVCENARKYAAGGECLELTTGRDGGSFRIEVRDFGPGVPAAERDAIFARFRRGTAHRHGSIPGVGLGLFLARSIVHRHGGTLRCEAPPDGVGSSFVFTLPMTETPT